MEIRIDNPCTENWDRMRPEEQGRFCSSCQKMVIDFTAMSDSELLAYFSKPQASVCGRLQSSQLQRPLTPPRQPAHQLWHFLLAGVLVSTEAACQIIPEKPPVVNQTIIGD